MLLSHIHQRHTTQARLRLQLSNACDLSQLIISTFYFYSVCLNHIWSKAGQTRLDPVNPPNSLIEFVDHVEGETLDGQSTLGSAAYTCKLQWLFSQPPQLPPLQIFSILVFQVSSLLCEAHLSICQDSGASPWQVSRPVNCHVLMSVYIFAYLHTIGQNLFISELEMPHSGADHFLPARRGTCSP